MDIPNKLEAYHFYEEDWESFEELRDAFEWEIPETFNVASYVCDRWADREDDRVALYIDIPGGPDRSYTFRQIQNDANRLANYLESQGVERGDRIAVGGPQRVETLIAHVATWKLGAASVPVSSLLGTEGLRYRLDDCEAVAHVVDDTGLDTSREIAGDVESLETRILMGDAEPDGDEVGLWDALEGRSRQFDTVDTDPEEDFEIIYTSGTTGDPKGVRHAHRYVLGLLPSVVAGHRNMDVRTSDVARPTAEWSWAGTLNIVMLGNLYYGNPTVGSHGEFDPEREFELIEKYGVTMHITAPTAYRMMMQVEEPAERWNLDTVRVMVAGGEAVGSSLVSWMNETFGEPAIHPGYGQTECTFPLGHCEALGVPVVPGDNVCGKAYPGHEAIIVDPENPDRRLEAGEVGEICLWYEDNPACFKSYLGLPEKTAAKIHGEWMLTEDLGYRNDEGYIVYQSRADDVIITSGHRVGPEEIEEALARHDAVLDVGVIGVPDDTRGEIAKAFVVLVEDVDPSDSLVEELQSFVKDHLAKYEYPRAIEFLDELPTTTTGKIRRADLRDIEGIE